MAETNAPDSEPIRVAIVEDDVQLSRNLRLLFEHSPGFACTGTCSTVAEAIDSVPRQSPDVVVMDINLPDGSGIDCITKLRTPCPDSQFMVLTAYENTETIFGALRAGACGYLLKRAMPDEILDAIREVHAGGAPMTSEIARKVLATFHHPTVAAPEIEELTKREQEILEHLLHGLANKEIANVLGISVATVKLHLRHIYAKLHARDRCEVMARFRKT